MSPEKDKHLVKNFPNLYRDRNGDMKETLMCWGFEVGDDWFDLICELSAELEKLILQLPEGERKSFRASQVKEKYAQLRFYMTSETDEMFNLINEAEDKSSRICDICGKAGKTVGVGWLKTRCKEHENV